MMLHRDKIPEMERKYRGKRAYDVDITQLVQPEVVHRGGRGHEIALREVLVYLIRGDVELVQDPLLDEAFLSGRL